MEDSSPVKRDQKKVEMSSDASARALGPSERWPRTAKYNRLRGAIQVFSRQWRMYPSQKKQRYDKEVERLLDVASAELHKRNYNPGWVALHAATRFELLVIDRKTLESRALALATEAQEKLSGWRRDAAKLLLPFAAAEASQELRAAALELERTAGRAPAWHELSLDEGIRLTRMPDDALRPRCWTVQWLLDGHAENVYMKQEVVVDRAAWLFAILSVLVLVALFAINFASTVIAQHASTPAQLTMVAVFGGMGAAFNGLRSLMGAVTRKVPEVILSVWFTAIRPAIGAAAAIVVCLAEISGIINVVAPDSTWALLTLAFVAGFSDALVLRVVGATDKKE